MSTPNDQLARQLAQDESLWRMWNEMGVTESTVLAVDFSFYAANKTAAEQLAESLRAAGLRKIETRTKRTLLIFKGWEVSAVEDGTWSLQKLQDQTRTYSLLAEKLGIVYDGCGAMMPGKNANAP